LDIGFNAGFSTLLMLNSNPHVKITCVDICEHEYVIPCYNKIKEDYGDRVKLVVGDSRHVLKQMTTKFDLIHIDGGHGEEVCENDIQEAYRMSKTGTIIIMDDVEIPSVNEIWKKYVKEYDMTPYNESIHENTQRVYKRKAVMNIWHDIRCVVKKRI